MASASSEELVTFDQSTRAFFLQYLRQSPSHRRISQNDRETIIEWLTNPRGRPSSQKAFSRRNYVRKTFTWDAKTRNLLAIAMTRGDNYRIVVTDDTIADVVEFVHQAKGHAGWDVTWKDISASYYGILRMDVIFLLKRCPICANDPSKRPKSSKATVTDSRSIDDELLEFVKPNELEFGDDAWSAPKNEESRSE